MSHLVVIGAGSHAREVAEILRFQGALAPGGSLLGFIDENHEAHGKVLDGLPVLGGWDWFDGVDRGHISVVCAVGNPGLCRRLVARALALGLNFATAVSNRAYVSPLAHIGQGVTVFPNVAVHTGARVGDFSILNVAVTVSHDSIIGSYCNINPGAHVAGNVSVGDGCYIGMGSNIIQNCSIGAGSIIGAGGAVVTDVPAYVTAAGVPARIIRPHEEIETVNRPVKEVVRLLSASSRRPGARE